MDGNTVERFGAGSGSVPRPEADVCKACADAPDGAVRERILQAFAARLDAALRDEAVPDGIPLELLRELENAAEPSGELPQNDFHAMWSALIAATQEVKLQGRAFAKLRESLEPLAAIAPALEAVRNEMRDLAGAVGAAQEEERVRAERDMTAHIQEEHLALLLDLRDRLKRGLENSERHLRTARQRARTGLFGRFLGHAGRDGLEAIEALQTGVRLAFDRLDDAVREMGVTEIDCVGQDFDPSRMCAVDVAKGGEGSEGQVLEVYRPGYERNGEVLRQAEVKVARSI